MDSSHYWEIEDSDDQTECVKVSMTFHTLILNVYIRSV